MMSIKRNKGRGLFFVLALLLVAACQDKPKHLLPFYGPRTVNPANTSDTLYHTVPDFRFVNQDGKTVTQEDFKGKIYIANFFFTSCPTICPKMMTQLKRFRSLLKDDEVRILSHTVDPKRDSVETLKAYADKNAIDTRTWDLVTGNQQVIYEHGMEGYFLSAGEDAQAEGGFLHSEILILVDPDGRLRGLYEGTVTEEVDRLLKDVELLKKEYGK